MSRLGRSLSVGRRAGVCSSPQNSQARFGDPSRSRRTPHVILRERSDGRIFSFQDPSPGAQDDNRRAGACLQPLPPSGRLLIAGRCSTHWGWLFCKPGAAGCQKMQAGGAAGFEQKSSFSTREAYFIRRGWKTEIVNKNTIKMEKTVGFPH